MSASTQPRTMSMAQALNLAMSDALEEDQRVVVFGADVGTLGGVFRITDGLTAKYGKGRCFDTPLAEAGIVGAAIGMAMNGIRPIVEMQFDAFAYPAFEQLVSHLAKMANRTHGSMRLPVVVRIPYGGGVGGVEHHSDSSEAYYAHTPGLTVLCPATPADAYGLLRAAVQSPDPVIFLEPKKLYPSTGLVESGKLQPIGRARMVRTGSDVTLITYGSALPVTLRAADIAAEEGLSVSVVDLRTIVPLDEESIIASVAATGRAVVVAESAGFASVASEIAALLSEVCFPMLKAPVRRVTGLDIPYPPPAFEHLYLPDADRIMEAIDSMYVKGDA